MIWEYDYGSVSTAGSQKYAELFYNVSDRQFQVFYGQAYPHQRYTERSVFVQWVFV